MSAPPSGASGPGVPPERTPRRALLVAVLGAMSAFGPMSMDFYLPGMPRLADELGAGDSLAQATMAVCMLGLAVGQLVVGPWSDRVGRRLPLLIGVALFAVASVGCAFAPTIEVLLAVRFVQGVGGAAGLVVARAIVRDLYSGAAAARTFSRLMLVIGISPILAPVLGGALLAWTDWRGLFLILGAVGVLLFVLAMLVVPDTLGAARHEAGGVRALRRQVASVLAHRQFMLLVLATGVNQGVLFAFIQMSSLVYQREYGLDEQTFALAFAINSVGMLIVSQINGSIVSRFAPARIMVVSVSTALVSSALVVVGAALALPLLAIAVVLFVAVSMHGASMPNLSALALEPFARGAGLASAFIGCAQFFIGGLVPVVASLAGTSMLTMGVTMTACAVLALALALLARRVGPAGEPAAP
ncbi:Bcr/CflA family drug resistance efflux transporter [Pseudoclavibacter endophyticus]|nr:multidrug effflux MFS transporter [Pseudoclavibacter endophyticus]GGA70552.1 Bcr/CflA family drug resistance efflux transporter [Pseudoclavibacter endophyticus]